VVIAATDDPAVNAAVSQAAKARDLPVNVVDSPELCSFIFPSIVDRSPMIVAVSTGGASPVLARLMRAKLETLLPATYGRLAQLGQRAARPRQAAFRQPGAAAHLLGKNARRHLRRHGAGRQGRRKRKSISSSSSPRRRTSRRAARSTSSAPVPATRICSPSAHSN
jgi:siroheme synthase (precorrin-2 oxidase/ferrochelatase)